MPRRETVTRENMNSNQKAVKRIPGVSEKPTVARADGKTLVQAVVEFLQEHIFLAKPELYLLVGTWTIATHLHRIFDFMGYLLIHSAEKQCGKTKLMELLDYLVYQSTGLQVSPTVATLFRSADKHTQLLDEIDTWSNQDSWKDILNAGFKQGSFVTRCDPDSGFRLKRYPVYGPKALAGIGTSALHETTRDRTFCIEMIRRKQEEAGTRIRPRQIAASGKVLKQLIVDWVESNRKDIARFYESADYPEVAHCAERTIDISEPLVAILEVMYKGRPDRNDVITELIKAIERARKEQHSASESYRLLLQLFSLTEIEDPLVGNPTELKAQLANCDPPPEEFAISRVLHQYGFEKKSMRRQGTDDPRYRFVIRRARLSELIERFAPKCQETKADEAPQPAMSNEEWERKCSNCSR